MALVATLDHARAALTSGQGLSDGQAQVQAVLDRARPALTFRRQMMADADVALGTSKLGGRPDMGADIPWPIRAPYPGIDAIIDTYPEVIKPSTARLGLPPNAPI